MGPQTLEAVFVHGEYQLKLDYTVQGADLINGEVVNMGNGIVGICNIVGGAEVGELISLPTRCVWRLKKDGTTGPVFSFGEQVWWDASANLAIEAADADPDADFPCGVCVKAAGTNEDGVWVDLNQVYPSQAVGLTGGVVDGLRVAYGVHETVAASDTVDTGLNTVVAVVAQLGDDPVDGVMHVTATIGDQAGTPAAGSILIKGWKSTDGDATLIAATTFAKKVNWIAIGT